MSSQNTSYILTEAIMYFKLVLEQINWISHFVQSFLLLKMIRDRLLFYSHFVKTKGIMSNCPWKG